MPRQRISSFSIVMMVMGVLCIGAACLPAAFVYRALTELRDYSVDATATEVAAGVVGEGEVVHLRSLRERGSPVVLADGRVLYPAVEEPHVMVECGESECEGSLIGRVETLRLEGPPPPDFPVPPTDRILIVRVGGIGDEARGHAMLAAAMAGALVLLGLSCVGIGATSIARRRRG